MMTRLAIISLLLLTACGSPAQRQPVSTEPTRIVSLDYCADQYVLKFADREDILALSPHAEDEYSYMREAAAGIDKVRAVAEDVLVRQPDLVVRTYGGGPNATAFFEQAGIPVLQIGYAASLEDIPGVVQQAADALGAPVKGQAVINDMQARLDAIEKKPGRRRALYMTSGGVTTGPGTMIDEMLRAAGYENFETRPGWHTLPLERLTRERPDVIASAFYETGSGYMDAWSASGHPIARRQLRERPVVRLDSAWTACGGWFLVDAIEALANAPLDDRIARHPLARTSPLAAAPSLTQRDRP